MNFEFIDFDSVVFLFFLFLNCRSSSRVLFATADELGAARWDLTSSSVRSYLTFLHYFVNDVGRVTTSFPVESLETGGTNQFSSSMTNLGTHIDSPATDYLLYWLSIFQVDFIFYRWWWWKWSSTSLVHVGLLGAEATCRPIISRLPTLSSHLHWC